MAQPHDPIFTIDAVVSSKQGVQLSVPSTAHNVPRLFEETDNFSYERYALEERAPEPLRFIDTSVLDQRLPRCLDMPIRLAGQEGYALPEEWKALEPLITQIAATEHAHNTNWTDYNTYITVDCKDVQPGEQQRHGGLHVDGFQGERIEEKTKITRNYVVTTNGGTRFYPQRFIVADPAKFNVFQGFDLQAESFIIAQEGVVHFMDAYCVHESGIVDRAGMRTFLRVTYDLKKFDRLGNTHNSMLDYDWDMVARSVHETLATPHYTDILASPYFPNPSKLSPSE